MLWGQLSISHSDAEFYANPLEGKLEFSKSQEFVQNYWQSKAGVNPAPSRQDINIQELKNVLSQVVMFDVLRDPDDFRYRLIGTAVRENFSEDYTGAQLRDIEGEGPDSVLWSCLANVRHSMRPEFTELPYSGPYSRLKRMSNLFLPLIDKQGDVAIIMAVCAFHDRTITT